ncbi:MAG: hypothetical protein CVU50_02650 [Candidatus Cloacimonetes bacterium HGW-Cloacimonetes-3]|jgi:flagellar hook assembly protein FlgD|nr:MAG: hypothetical protein CVU50_02650 [Candidatus Cloacimonetes bacterium HGW-Cloacimonetes-3]
MVLFQTGNHETGDLIPQIFEVRKLFSSSLQEGQHKLIWDGRSDNGSTVASGIYIYRISTNQGSITKKMILAK